MQGVAHIHEYVQNQSPTPAHKPNHKLAGMSLLCQGLQELGRYQENIWQKICLSAVHWVPVSRQDSHFLPFYCSTAPNLGKEVL